MIKVEKVKIGLVPPRTIVECEVPLNSDRIVLDGAEVVRKYRCADCDFETRKVSDMEFHQRHHFRFHTWFQEARRFFVAKWF